MYTSSQIRATAKSMKKSLIATTKNNLKLLSVDQINYIKIKYLEYVKTCDVIKNNIDDLKLNFKHINMANVQKLKNLYIEHKKLISIIQSQHKPSLLKSFKGETVEYRIKEFFLEEIYTTIDEKYSLPNNIAGTLAYKITSGGSGPICKSANSGKSYVDKLSIIQNEIESIIKNIIKFEEKTVRDIILLNKEINNYVEISNGKNIIKVYLPYLNLKDIDISLVSAENREIEKAKIAAYDKKSREKSSTIKRKLGNQLKIYSKCPYCHCDIDLDNAHADHIYPIKKGGQSSSRNMVYVCSSCNLKKGQLTLRNFLKMNNINEKLTYEILEKLGKEF